MKKGFLHKQGGNYKNWKRRYFILSENLLSYYKSPGDAQPIGVIQLLYSNVKLMTNEEKDHVFGLITPARTYLFCADTDPEVSNWMAALQMASEAISQRMESEPASPVQHQIYHEGNLLKEGNNLVKDWKRRWFILEGTVLSYYKDRKSVV